MPGPKKKTSKSNGKGKKAPKLKMAPARPLDEAAHDYALLLQDPCNAKVVPPIYPGSDSGFLFRADSFGVVGTGVGENAGYIHWSPGYPNATNTDLLIGAASAAATAVAATAYATGPAKTFLANNSRAVRCIAACMKISFIGAESARAGRIHFGQTAAGLIDSGTSVSADGVAQALTNYTRTPADTIELIWKPSLADAEFCDPTEAASATVRDRHASLTVAFAGLPAAVGINYHVTAVYEWLPVTGLGVAGNPSGKARSRNSLDDVVDFLISRGERFARYVGHGIATGALGTVAEQVSAVFGNMPAIGVQRTIGWR